MAVLRVVAETDLPVIPYYCNDGHQCIHGTKVWWESLRATEGIPFQTDMGVRWPLDKYLGLFFNVYF